MPKVCTNLSQAQIDEIEKSGKSVYQFLKEAAEEKLVAEKEKKEIDRIGDFLDLHAARLDKKIEEKILKALEIHLSERQTIEEMFGAMIERYEKSREGASNIVKMVKEKLEKIENHLGRR